MNAAVRHQALDLRWPALAAGFVSTAVALPLLALLLERTLRREDMLAQVLAILGVAVFRRIWEGLILWAFGQ